MGSRIANAESFVDAVEEKQFNEEYKLWKKNHVHLYELLMVHALEWPTFTVQWLPDVQPSGNPNSTKHSFILSSYKGSEKNQLLIGSVDIPDGCAEEPKKKPVGVMSMETIRKKIRIDLQINHSDPIFRARYMPQNCSIIATKGASKEVLIFDISKSINAPDHTGECCPDQRLEGHDQEGFGLSWNQHKAGHLLSGSDDSKICLWDITHTTHKASNPLATFTSHSEHVEDVAWHSLHETLFGSVGSEGRLMIWDTRNNNLARPCHSIAAHTNSATTLGFSPFSEFVFATGSADKTLALWDLRNLNVKLHSLEGHKGGIFHLQFSPNKEQLLASSASDKCLHLWDLDRIGATVDRHDEDNGPAELIFIHGGHTAKITDFSWNLNLPDMICSVAEDNIIQIWEPCETIVETEESHFEGEMDDRLAAIDPKKRYFYLC